MADEPTVPLGIALKRHRLAGNFSVADAATFARVSITTIQRWESGALQPKIFPLARLASAYRTTIDELLEGVLPEGDTIFDVLDALRADLEALKERVALLQPAESGPQEAPPG